MKKKPKAKRVKFPRGVVVFCGDRLGATEYLYARAPTGTPIDGGTSTSGVGGTSTSGVGGTISILYWDGEKYRRAIGAVGKNGILPNVAYVVKDGKLVPKEGT